MFEESFPPGPNCSKLGLFATVKPGLLTTFNPCTPTGYFFITENEVKIPIWWGIVGLVGGGEIGSDGDRYR